MRAWIREWWVTFRQYSRFTRAGRELRWALREPFDPDEWVEVERPS